MTRNVLVVSSAESAEQLQRTLDACSSLEELGMNCVFAAEDIGRLRAQFSSAPSDKSLFTNQELEVVLVLGGDGSILRAAELARAQDAPILGVNLGHIGFMAEAEVDDLTDVLTAISNKNYTVGHRVALEVKVFQDSELVFESWALNEVSVEKSSRERMLEVVVEVDSRPVSSFGCDGVLVSTPTGSTAYAFSAGGPVIWPDVQAMMLVPISAHALFARPLVVAPDSELAIEVLRRSPGAGVIWCDGRRATDLGPGSRIEVKKSPKAVPMAILNDAPFSDRLVRKFALPVTGWRGPEATA